MGGRKIGRRKEGGRILEKKYEEREGGRRRKTGRVRQQKGGGGEGRSQRG